MRPHPVTRRRLALGSLALPFLHGCAPPLAPLTAQATGRDAQALLDESAAAHGLAALRTISDISVSYAGEWHWLVGRLQPDLVDAGFRGGSQERLLLRDRVVAQAHAGPDGHKQVVRSAPPGVRGEVRVWYNGVEAQDGPRRDAAALVADGYSLFLLGPMLLTGARAGDRALIVERAGAETITVGERDYRCDVMRVRIAPGLGRSEADQLALFVDREARLMRRVRFTLEGLESTRGAVAEVDAWDHVTLRGVRWPTRFHERLLRPAPLAVHDWSLTGLDLDRGLDGSEVDGPAFTGRAVAAAAPLPDGPH